MYSSQNPVAPKNWVIFDGDNTLWLIEHLYDEARENLCHHLVARGHDAHEVDKFQRNRDRELHASYGYSACRFARSFEDTALKFAPESSGKDILHVRNLALEVFEREATLPDGLDHLLKDLAQKYSLAIVTAGEHWVQKRRIEYFHLSHLFSAIEIVETKNASVFLGFCEKYAVCKENSWMVGDSINSDVIPATEAGLNAAYLAAKNWAVIEGIAADLPYGAISIKDLADLRSHLLANEN